MEKNEKIISGGYMQIPILEKTVTEELSGDFTLPDYQPDIKRLLRITAGVLPPSTYVGNHRAELEGGLDYYVLYMGSDNEVYCAPLSSEYKITVPVEGEDEEELLNLTASASVTADSVSGRVTSPKKLNIKCRLRARTTVLGEMPMGDAFENASEEIELLEDTAEVFRCYSGVGERISVSDDMICDSRDGEVRVICAEGNALMSEVSATAGGVAYRGDLYLKLLLCRENGGTPYCVTRKLPYSGIVPVEGVLGGFSALAKAYVCDLSVNVEEGRIATEVGLLVEAQACGRESVSYVKDLYSTRRKTDCSYKTVKMPTYAVATVGNFTLSDSLPLSETGIGQGEVVVDVSGVAIPEEYRFEKDRCHVEGRARFCILTEKEGEIAVSDIELPFRYECITQGETAQAVCDARVVSARARMDGERIGIDAEIGISILARGTVTEKLPDTVGFGEELTVNKGDLVICYPSREDSVWSVAKRYGKPLDSVVAQNRIDATLSPDSTETLKSLHHLTV